MSDVFWIRVEYRDGDTSRIMLYRKKIAWAGCGTMLWEGAVDESQYPVSISLWFNQRDYRTQIDKPVDSMGGSRSGRHELSPELWIQPVRFGLKSVHGTQPANALIRQVRIAPGGPWSGRHTPARRPHRARRGPSWIWLDMTPARRNDGQSVGA